jgi:Fibronectin type III domain
MLATILATFALALPAPGHLHARARTTTSITLAWQDRARGERVYELRRGERTLRRLRAGATRVKVAGLRAGRRYRFSVRACGASRCGGAASIRVRTRSAAGATLAIIGDTPYSAAQIANFHSDVQAINNDPAVSRVVHLGDIKSGSTQCTDTYFASIRSQFDEFADPLVYTPGDNEWTDCHRPNNGGYNPLERLAKIRSLFFDERGETLGDRVPIKAQAGPTIENVRWSQGGAEFGVIDVPGSNNSLLPWTGNIAPTPTQLAEVRTRIAADLAWIDRIFASARANGAAGVFVGMQADMFSSDGTAGYDQIVKRLAVRAHEFRRPVVLFSGGSHLFRVDHPFTPGDPLYGQYVTQVDAPNLTRVVVQGSTNCPHAYLRLDVDPTSRVVFSGQNVLLPLDPACDGAPALGGF